MERERPDEERAAAPQEQQDIPPVAEEITSPAGAGAENPTEIPPDYVPPPEDRGEDVPLDYVPPSEDRGEEVSPQDLLDDLPDDLLAPETPEEEEEAREEALEYLTSMWNSPAGARTGDSEDVPFQYSDEGTEKYGPGDFLPGDPTVVPEPDPGEVFVDPGSVSPAGPGTEDPIPISGTEPGELWEYPDGSVSSVGPGTEDPTDTPPDYVPVDEDPDVVDILMEEETAEELAEENPTEPGEVYE